MTKDLYLRQLRRQLNWRLPPDEVREVLSDYEGFFEEGLAEGKDEAALCEQFGAPKEAARALLREEGRRVGRLGLLAFAVWALVSWFNWWGMLNYLVKFPILRRLIVLSFVPLLCLVWRKIAVTARPSKGRIALTVGVPCALYLLFLATALLAVSQETAWWVEVAKDRYRAAAVGLLFADGYEGIANVTGLILLLVLVWGWTKSIWYLPVAAHCTGVLLGAARVIEAFTSVDVREPYLSAGALAASSLGWYAAGLASAAVVAVLIRRGGRNGRAA